MAILYLPSEEADAKETEALVSKEGRKCMRLTGDVGSHDVGWLGRLGLGGFGGGGLGVGVGSDAECACEKIQPGRPGRTLW